jgi:hypothetical protein
MAKKMSRASDPFFDIERFRLPPDWQAQELAARERKLLTMTPEQKEIFFKAEEDRAKFDEADAMREAMSDERWGKA